MPKGNVMELRAAVIVAALLLGSSVQVVAQSDDAARRADISAKGIALFTSPNNHCRAFRDLVAYAVGKTADPLQLIEDLKVVLIGNDIRDRRSGPYYIGRTPGASGDSGFKPELRDNSPQVEHAMAAIYL